MLQSYNGWPASKDQAEIGVKPFPIKGTAIKIRCAKDAGPLLAAFAAEFHTLPILDSHTLIGAAIRPPPLPACALLLAYTELFCFWV